MKHCLSDQQKVLDVMPELNHQRGRPPFQTYAGKTFSQKPKTKKHHNRIAIVKRFRRDQPRKPKPQDSSRLRTRPAKYIYLISLREMLPPMPQHDNHKTLEHSLMP